MSRGPAELGLLVVAERQRREVRRGRLGQVPLGDGDVVLCLGRDQVTVRDAHPRRRHGQGEVVERLVGGVVVDGVPGVGAPRLLHRPDLVVVVDREAGLAEVRPLHGYVDRLGRAGVLDHDLVALVLAHRRVHDQVLPVPHERRGGAVDGDLADLEDLAEVELEVVVGLGRAEGQRLGALERVGVRRPAQREVVVQGVDARVADLGVEGVLLRLAHGDVEVLGGRVGVGGRRVDG